MDLKKPHSGTRRDSGEFESRNPSRYAEGILEPSPRSLKKEVGDRSPPHHLFVAARYHEPGGLEVVLIIISGPLKLWKMYSLMILEDDFMIR
ncbi:hypothetical protein E3N88_28156 [Mikania micrantha]|uniref:Uncharacterized protein n=1 Tax=Mikania micrantha TaxID=192012 RepID=A0A5N6N1J9_9ASTR|nr:hypothetical protein E3N88_28156 [Mikania micrantha]